MLSQSMQDYLKTIYDLRQHSERATTNALAERLNIKASSVTDMVKKLAEMHLVEHERYQGVVLTPTGEKMALAIVRHHRLIELYLTEAMGYSWDKVHEEADRLEHAVSDEMADKMATLLGDPKIDPHGDPIPAKDGTVAAISTQTLSQVESGRTVRIERVRDEDSLLLQQFAALGLKPGVMLKVNRSNEMIRVSFSDENYFVVGADVARNIYVVE